MDQTAKQQIVERIKQANNVLVTVSTNPSVDQLAACIGLTLMLNKMDKHGTAVFSGKVPSTLEFLQPEKTLEPNTDSLRDFIISLDKSKADKLRYKVEDEVVRIFITPYRSSLSEKDLVFSQGDFNVDVVVALGVANREQIDAAITAHGRILHDAAVVALNRGEVSSDVGQMNWNDPSASSLSEMIVSISESFGSGLIDNQMATAFLTGIVSETERFSNAKTSPKVMTMSAQLMAAGANQQLIASKLNPGVQDMPAFNSDSPGGNSDKPDEPAEPGQLEIDHNDKPEPPPEPDAQDSKVQIDDQGLLQTKEEAGGAQQPSGNSHKVVEPLDSQNKKPFDPADFDAEGKSTKTSGANDDSSRNWLDPNGKPDRGGTLSANTKPEEYQEAVNPLSDNQPAPPEVKNDLLSHDPPPPPEQPKPEEKPQPDSQDDDYPAVLEPAKREPVPHQVPMTEQPKPEEKPQPEAPPPPDPPKAEPKPEPPAEPPKAEPTPQPLPSPSETPQPLADSVPAPDTDRDNHSHETLSQLQHEANAAASQPGSPDKDEHSARDAVHSALQSMPPDNTPLAALNALPLGEDIHNDQTPMPLPGSPADSMEFQLPNPDSATPQPAVSGPVPNDETPQPLKTETEDQPPSAPPVPPPFTPPFMNPASGSDNSSDLPKPLPPV